jgi:hypothetical protein
MTLKRVVRKAIATAVIAASLSVGLATSAGAGEGCIRLRPGTPLRPLTLCAPTN